MLIEFIQGELQIKGPNYIVIQVGGIGYRLFTSSFTLAKLPPVKEEVTVFTYLHVREDELSLYGFLSNEEKKDFCYSFYRFQELDQSWLWLFCHTYQVLSCVEQLYMVIPKPC